MKFTTIIDNISVEMKFSPSLKRLSINSKNEHKIDCAQLGINSYSLLLNGKSHYLTINKLIDEYEVIVDHYTQIVKVQDEIDILLEKFGIQNETESYAGEVHALIPGLVGRLFVKQGDIVEVGQKLLILEAMKMENEIDSPIAGLIENIHLKSGDKVEKGDLIMEIKN
jgi:biotin carboxyl carrier protein